MSYVSFQNPGLIDMRAVRTFGASSKETSNPIGFFGTGLKYAIAVAVRLGCEVEIYRGRDEHYVFGKKTTTIRVDDFELITMNDEELAFTTELGKKWEPWQAFRELWCNAIDEGGEVYNRRVKPRSGRTTVVVHGDPIADVYNIRDQIMLQSKPRWMVGGVEISHRRSSHQYYRGVRVGDLRKPSHLTYNVVGHPCELTEDRTLKYDWYWRNRVVEAIANADDPVLLDAVLDAEEMSFEASLDFSDEELGPALVEALGARDLRKISNPTFMRALFKMTGEKRKPKKHELDENDGEILTRARLFLRDMGYEITYPVVVTEEMDENILGLAADDTIYINRRTLMMGSKMVAGTLFEEQIHLQHKLVDESRTMQNWLIDALMTTGEKLVGRPV